MWAASVSQTFLQDYNGMSRPVVITRNQLFSILGFQVKDPSKYEQAFVHKSALREFCFSRSYERLEFLGDSVLDFVVAKYLYDKWPDANEGQLTRVRTRLVAGTCLCDFARKLGLHEYVVMNNKAIKQGWNHNDRILEDIFEALVACIYLDMGLLVAKEFIIQIIETNIDWDDVMIDTNDKDILMRYTQATKRSLPVYELVEDGSDTSNGSDEGFYVKVSVDGVEMGRGRHIKKRNAQQQAAKIANERLGLERSVAVC